jgi:hypothetical protein
MTIKGLEPEIERILKNSRDKVRKLQEEQKDLIAKKTAKVEKKFEKKLRDEKEKYKNQSDQSVSDERDYFNKKLKSEIERVETGARVDRERMKENYEKEITLLEGKSKKVKESLTPNSQRWSPTSS